MRYINWLRGGCGCNNGCSDINPCDCDNILLEISNLHTDDQVLQDEIDDLSGKVETKLDASAYTPVDLSDYYTKEQSDEKFLTEHQPLKTINGESLVGEGNIVISGGSGTTIDAYTKQESDAKYALKTEIPSLSGYATEQWVENKNYLTEHQPLKTINGNVISGTGNIVIEASGTSITVDDHLDSTSTNPVENKAITGALNGKLDASAYTPTEQVQSDWNVTDSGSTAYIKNKPTIPSLSGYATEQWVLDKNYVTSGNVETQITNRFWCGTQAEYDLLPSKQNNVLYLIHE